MEEILVRHLFYARKALKRQPIVDIVYFAIAIATLAFALVSQRVIASLLTAPLGVSRIRGDAVSQRSVRIQRTRS